jgi:integrase
MKPNSQNTKDSYTRRLTTQGFNLDTLTQDDYPEVKRKLSWSETTFRNALALLGKPTSAYNRLNARMRDYTPTKQEKQVIRQELGDFGHLLAYLGCRFSEMWSMELDIGDGSGRADLLIHSKKGCHPIRLPLEDLPVTLRDCAQRWTSDGQFRTHHKQIRYRWAKLVEQGLIDKRCTPHAFRHMVITEMLNNGEEISSVARAMGHRSIQSTFKYRHNSPKQHASLRNKVYADL